MPAKKLNIVIEQGDTFDRLISVIEDGAAKNLTGFTLGGVMKDEIDGTVLATFSLAIEGPATDGKIRWTLSATLTRALERGGKYDVRINSSSDVATRLLQGNAKLAKEITTSP